MSRPRDSSAPMLSVVVPILNEEECVEELARRVTLAAEGHRFEVIFVDDGSVDGTPDRLRELRARDPRIKVIRLTRSFGHQAALIAGLRFCTGDVVVTMDGDLQHPPELIPKLVIAWREGHEVVQAVRVGSATGRRGWRSVSSDLFYRAMNALGGIQISPGSADFRLLDRRAVKEILALPEHFVFVRGLVPWLGFSTAEVRYEADERFAGASKYGLRRMLRLALNGLFSFSVLPLRLIVSLGLLTTLAGVSFGIFAIVSQLAGRTQTGWTSLTVLILIFGGVQLLSLGIVSEYVGRTYEEAKRRPRYVIDRVEGIEWE